MWSQRHAYLCKACAEQSEHIGVWAVQLLDDLKALVELREDVHHGAGEQSMLRGLQELGG